MALGWLRLADQFAQGANNATALQAVASGPFKGDYDPGNMNYGAKAAGAIKTTANQLDCLKKNGYIN